MQFWNKSRPADAPLVDKPLDQSPLPAAISGGRNLFAEPVDDDLGIPPLNAFQNEGIRVPDLRPADLSSTGVGDTSSLNTRVHTTESSIVTIIENVESHTHDDRYYTETELNAGQLDNRYFTEVEHLNSSAGAGDAGKPVKLDAGGCIDATMINDGDIDHDAIANFVANEHLPGIDEDNMASDSSVHVSTQQSVKAYVVAGLAGKQSTLTNSAGLAAALSDETGTGLAVFNSGPTITSGLFNELLDTGGNEVIKFTATGSAENELGVANAASGGAVVLSTKGDNDAAVQLHVSPKGYAGIKLSSLQLLLVHDDGGATLRVQTHSNTAGTGSLQQFQRARGTLSSPLDVLNGDTLGKFTSAGWMNSGWRYQGGMFYRVDGAPSGSSVPTKIDFETSASGARQVRLSIYAAGNIRVVGTNHFEFDGSTCYLSSPSANTMRVHASILELWGAAYERITMNQTGIGFFAATPVAKPTISGARDVSEEALADLLTSLALLGLITDSTTAS